MVRIRFISLFVPNLADATSRYEKLLQTSPSDIATSAPALHPFSVRGPVVFELGNVALALYECDNRTTHAGDVGVGLECPAAEVATRMREQGGQVFWGPDCVPDDPRTLAIGMMPDRHFFELMDPAAQLPNLSANFTDARK